MGHDGVTSGYSTPIGFYRLTGCQRDPWDMGVTNCEDFDEYNKWGPYETIERSLKV